MITNTISILEAVTLTIILIGIPIALVAIWAVVGDSKRLRASPGFIEDGARHKLAKGRIRAEARKLMSKLLFANAVIALMTVPSSGRSSLNYISISLIVAILGTIIGMIIDTLLYLRERTQIVQLLEEETTQPPQPTTEGAKVIIEPDGTGTLVSPVTLEERNGH